MSGQFSVGVVIGGMIGSTFRSAMSGTRRALDSLSDTSRRLQERQNALTRATERYGQLGSSRMQHLNSELLRVSRTMEQIERQQRRLSAASATSDALKANRMVRGLKRMAWHRLFIIRFPLPFSSPCLFRTK